MTTERWIRLSFREKKKSHWFTCWWMEDQSMKNRLQLLDHELISYTKDFKSASIPNNRIITLENTIKCEWFFFSNQLFRDQLKVADENCTHFFLSFANGSSKSIQKTNLTVKYFVYILIISFIQRFEKKQNQNRNEFVLDLSVCWFFFLLPIRGVHNWSQRKSPRVD